MSDYTADWQSALTDVRNAGAAVTFTGDTTVSGYAIGVRGKGKRFGSDTLVETENPLLFFIPSTYGAKPALNALATWGGTEYAVKDALPFAPNGTAIGSYVELER
jgi:hypothetical protein